MTDQQDSMPEILIPALRQYKHNTGLGFVPAFEYEETIKIFSEVVSKDDYNLLCVTLDAQLSTMQEQLDLRNKYIDGAKDIIRDHPPVKALIDAAKDILYYGFVDRKKIDALRDSVAALEDKT